MRHIHLRSTDPAFNLAAEEWLLHNTDTDIFMLWRNTQAVIVGKNQNAGAEINQEFVRQRDIAVIRRITGGGAVFHDLGNVNFTFIHLDRPEQGIDFRLFTTPIVEALQRMGVPCSFDGRNDLAINGLKISGNAQHLEKDRVLHHGTLLFSSAVEDISAALTINPAKYADKSVKSVRKRVTNIGAHLPEPMDVETFISHLMADIAQNPSPKSLNLREDEIRGIEALKKKKYATWEWNYGVSPQYDFTHATSTPGGLVETHLNVKNGRIQALKIYGDFFGAHPVEELANRLIGCPHEARALAERLDGVPVDRYIHGVDADTLVECFF